MRDRPRASPSLENEPPGLESPGGVMPGKIVPKWTTPPSYPEAVSLAYIKKEDPKLNPLEDICTKEYEPSSLCYSFLLHGTVVVCKHTKNMLEGTFVSAP